MNFVSAAVYLYCKGNNGWNILIGKRAGSDARFQGGLYNVPVGMRENGESPVENAVRECYEETGIRLQPNQLQFVNGEEWGYGKAGANFCCILQDNIENYQIGEGDWENERFFWCPVTDMNKYNWAYGMNNTAMSIFNSYVNKLNENMKKKIRLNESTLRKMIHNIVSEAINESRKSKLRHKYDSDYYGNNTDENGKNNTEAEMKHCYNKHGNKNLFSTSKKF